MPGKRHFVAGSACMYGSEVSRAAGCMAVRGEALKGTKQQTIAIWGLCWRGGQTLNPEDPSILAGQVSNVLDVHVYPSGANVTPRSLLTCHLFRVYFAVGGGERKVHSEAGLSQEQMQRWRVDVDRVTKL